ncbi:hypothetical protein ACG04Q_12075 [Roseateles sp. DXS20W]|uniref:Uncharacterized protein n=2 Tax=Pelomonas lactea TaxID=3299030 RepID=A0ABW7GKD5_9BURK
MQVDPRPSTEEQARAAEVSSWLAQRLIPDPLRETVDLSDMPQSVANYLAARGVGLPSLIASLDLQKSLFEEAATYLREASASDGRRDRAMERLGSAGNLPIGDYELSISDESWAAFAPMESMDSVREAVRSPDFVQHLQVPIDAGKLGSNTSWLAKVMSRKGGLPYVLLVEASRSGKTLNFGAAWRLYPEYVQYEGASTGFELLMCFLARYGVATRLMNTGEFKIFHESPVDMAISHRNERGEPGGRFYVEANQQVDFLIHHMFTKTLLPDESAIRFFHSYHVNMDMYRADVSRAQSLG